MDDLALAMLDSFQPKDDQIILTLAEGWALAFIHERGIAVRVSSELEECVWRVRLSAMPEPEIVQVGGANTNRYGLRRHAWADAQDGWRLSLITLPHEALTHSLFESCCWSGMRTRRPAEGRGAQGRKEGVRIALVHAGKGEIGVLIALEGALPRTTLSLRMFAAEVNSILVSHRTRATQESRRDGPNWQN